MCMERKDVDEHLAELNMKVGYSLSHIYVVSAVDGFITSHHLNELVREGWDVIGFDGVLAYVKKP